MNNKDAVETKNVVVRTRPQKVAVLAASNIGKKDMLLIVEFLSRIWGGKYCPILIVHTSDKGSQAKKNLIAIRPDIVLCVGLNFKEWSITVNDICQPRGIDILNDTYLKELFMFNRHKLIPATSVISEALEKSPQQERDNLYFFEKAKPGVFSVFMAFGFGFLPEKECSDYAGTLNAKPVPSPADLESYLKTCTGMSTRWSWIDFASKYLSTINLFGQFPMPPTIIVCRDRIADYSLFWNLRSQLGIGSSGTIVLFPEKEIDNSESIQLLTEWTIKSHIKANYCVIRSSTVAEHRLEYLAKRLRPRLKSSEIEYVDVKNSTESAPIIVPYDKNINAKVIASGNQISFECIAPDLVQYTRSTNSWICDFVKETDTNRALCELVLPPRNSATQVLNTLAPPRIGLRLDKLRCGPDSLSLKCSSNEPVISFGNPNAEEVITEILKEAGIQPSKDEKRIRYSQVINMLGGLEEAFLAFSGSSRKVIEVFIQENSKSSALSNPLTIQEIKSKAQLSTSGTAASRPLFDTLSKHLPKHAKHIAQQRFEKYFEYDISHGTKEQEIVNRLVERGILKRKWKLDTCSLCDKKYWVEHIDINKPVHCPGCGNIIILSNIVNLGYELNELVHLAIREGIIPVVLTAHFLYNTTSKGFIWLPGVKCESGRIKTDFDLICICDGHLIAAECKGLDKVKNNSRVWPDIVSQLENPLKLAQTARFEGFIIASLRKDYPQHFRNKLDKMKGNSFKISYLNNEDLTSGRRKIKRGEHEWPITINDLLSRDIKRKPRMRKIKGTRRISF